MPFLNPLKALLNAFISFINDLPRKHFFALIILFVCLLIISFLPSQSQAPKNIKRQLIIPVEKVTQAEYSKAEPVQPQREIYGDTDIDFTGTREIEWTIKEGDSLSNLFQSEGISAAVLHELQEADKLHLRLGNLVPGQVIKLLVDSENNVLALKIKIDFANTLSFVLKDESYVSLLETEDNL